MEVKLVMHKDNIIVFLNKTYIQNIDLTDKSSVEKYLGKLILQIKRKYDIELYGYYNITLYVDMNYGIIINIKKEELEYLDYFNNELEMNIEVIEDSFLYQIEDIFSLDKYILNKFEIYKNKEKLFLKAKENISDIELGLILENAKMMYGKKAKEIILKSQIVKV